MQSIIAKKGQNKTNNTMIIAGPCSAETRSQVILAAKELADQNLDYFRAGIWKPRTRPNSFEGVGEIGLEWLKEVKEKYGMKCCIEVAVPAHVEMAIKAGIDAVWLGSRTTTNPFAVQEIATALSGVNIPVWVKNPMNADLNLWIGAIERIGQAGIDEIAAIHRGFSHYGPSVYRNEPIWEIPRALKSVFPEIPIIHDPSHIAGNTDLIEPLISRAMQENMDGLMIECHPDPSKAWTDAKQQIPSRNLGQLLAGIRSNSLRDLEAENLENWRREINYLDENLIHLLDKRAKLSLEIGRLKRTNNKAILQEKRWGEVLSRNVGIAQERNLNVDYISQLFELIHQESIRLQLDNVDSKQLVNGMP